jgi:UDP-glucose 4-epimerase
VKPAEVGREFSGARVLVAGGMGFIGSNLARRLADLGAAVTVMDAQLPEYGGNAFNLAGYEDRLQLRRADLRDPDAAAECVRGQEFIFNLAGQVGHVLSMRDPLADLDLNLRGTLAFLETCRRENSGARTVFASTRQVYGPPRYLPVDEEHPLNPIDVNAIHKLTAERYHLLYQRVYGLPAVILRLTNVYGPRMRVKDNLKTFIGLWIRQVLDGEEITVYGDGRTVRDLLFVDDAVDALLLAALHSGSDGQIYNLGGGESASLLELAELLIRLNGGGACRLQPYPAQRRPIEIGSFAADSAKAKAELGWQPITPLETGLAATLEYYRRNRERYR